MDADLAAHRHARRRADGHLSTHRHSQVPFVPAVQCLSKGLRSQIGIAKSPNAKVVVIGNPKNALPAIFSGQ